jgi:hypothetical protein
LKCAMDLWQERVSNRCTHFRAPTVQFHVITTSP